MERRDLAEEVAGDVDAVGHKVAQHAGALRLGEGLPPRRARAARRTALTTNPASGRRRRLPVRLPPGGAAIRLSGPAVSALTSGNADNDAVKRQPAS